MEPELEFDWLAACIAALWTAIFDLIVGTEAVLSEPIGKNCAVATITHPTETHMATTTRTHYTHTYHTHITREPGAGATAVVSRIQCAASRWESAA